MPDLSDRLLDPTDDEYWAARDLVMSLGRPVSMEDDDEVLRAVEVVEAYEQLREGR